MSFVKACYVVPGLPHFCLAHERSPKWLKLHEAMLEVGREIDNTNDVDCILYFSTQWLSVLGYLFQTRSNPSWVHVDPNWHEYGSISYEFKIDVELSGAYEEEVSKLGHYTRRVDYQGFPIDTGVVVAQKYLNPKNRLPASMISCNMYAEKQETLAIGQAAIRALERLRRKAIVVVVSGLSSRFHTTEIDPREDVVSSLKDDEWNQKILDLLREGRLEDVSEATREFARQANADLQGKGFYWLNGLSGKSNNFRGRIFDYQPVWGTGAAVVGLYPNAPIAPTAGLGVDESDLVESAQGRNVAISRNLQGPNVLIGRNLQGRHVEQKHAETMLDNARQEINIISTTAPEPVGPYPHARRAGDLLFLSGIGPRKRGQTQIPGVTLSDSGEILEYDIEIQTESVIENVKTVLSESGVGWKDIVDVQVFLTNMKRDFKKFNDVYRRHFTTSGPTRTTVEVGALPTPIAVEFKVIARIP